MLRRWAAAISAGQAGCDRQIAIVMMKILKPNFGVSATADGSFCCDNRALPGEAAQSTTAIEEIMATCNHWLQLSAAQKHRAAEHLMKGNNFAAAAAGPHKSTSYSL